MADSQLDISVSLHYATSSSVGQNANDPDDYVLPIRAEILGHVHLTGRAHQAREVTLGKCKFYLVRVGNAVNDHVSLTDVFDTYQETNDAAAVLFDYSSFEFSKPVQKKFSDAFSCDDILLLHYLTIEPFARGQRIGLSVIERVIRDWSSGCALVVMKPFPLQFEAAARKGKQWSRLELGSFPTSKPQAFHRLRSYYEQLGFERMGRSEFYAICPANRIPSAQVLKLPDTVKLPTSIVEELIGKSASDSME